MTSLLIIGHAQGVRRWQHELQARLAAAGHLVSVRHATSPPPNAYGLDLVLGVERKRFGPSLADLCEPLSAIEQGDIELIIDLTGHGSRGAVPTLTIEFADQSDFASGLTGMVASPNLTARIDGVAVGSARPMLSDRLWLSRASNDILAGAMSLVLQTVDRFSAGQLSLSSETDHPVVAKAPYWRSYPLLLARGLVERATQKLKRGKRPFYWQVAYRLIDGPGVAETGRLDGVPFNVLPDDGERFYADPFVLKVDSRHYLFVEEYPFATGRGVISVAELGDDGTFGSPRIVLQEPHHLSYPQVFSHGDDIFMMPESASARELVLYRATAFPDGWVRDTVLIAGKDINDATLLIAHGTFWLFATERNGYGSPSDTMVVYSAPELRGPWTAHHRNPIVIDHSGARPGGAFIRKGDDVYLPVQDGSRSYGGGLGLMRLEELSQNVVRFSAPSPVLSGPAWARNGIHTLNRAGAFEVVDSAG